MKKFLPNHVVISGYLRLTDKNMTSKLFMEIKKDRKIIITGSDICLIVGVISELCGVYWLVQSMFFHNTNFPAMFGSVFIGLFLILLGRKNRQQKRQ